MLRYSVKKYICLKASGVVVARIGVALGIFIEINK